MVIIKYKIKRTLLITINLHVLKCPILKRILQNLTFFVEKKGHSGSL